MKMKSAKTAPDIIYTKVDEAPELASASLLPIIRMFTSSAGIIVGTKDISLAGRILASFSHYLAEEQIHPDDLLELSETVQQEDANIIKLPNISASVPQLNAAIMELQEAGFDIPGYPENPQNDKELANRDIYGLVLGSAVNPILREGNSDRRAPKSVKLYAQKNPHSMGDWSSVSKTHVSTMTSGDFYSNEKSKTIEKNSEGASKIEFWSKTGEVSVLKDDLTLNRGDVVDATMMSCEALRDFINIEIKDAKEKGVLFSIHLKATMMKISDPIIFGHVVSVFFKDVFDKNSEVFSNIDIDSRNGLGELFKKIETLPTKKRKQVEADIATCIDYQPDLYMVNSEKGISNLHVPSDVIIDASMPSLIRGGGKGWAPDGSERDTKCVIPDSSYASIYDETIKFCKEFGAFDPSKMGTVSNVGLMAQKAEEYGSHPQTFECPDEGSVRVVNKDGEAILSHNVSKGDIWRMCITRVDAINDWIKLAVKRAQATKSVAVFWLNNERAHDCELIEKVQMGLKNFDTSGLDIQILSPRDATRHALECIARGGDTISVTGNVLRDYITDLFPILEVGTSAKMLSIVPLMNGGGMFETGAGGSAPKHVQQLLEEGHLRWDSLGEFCALVASLELLSEKKHNKKAAVLAKTLDIAIGKVLDSKKSPSRKVGEIDNRGSHFYLAFYWSEALALQNENVELKEKFSSISRELKLNESVIISELLSAQGASVNLGGYYMTNPTKVEAVMRPSPTLNAIVDSNMKIS